MSDPKQITIEGARIRFKNFAGKEGQYNREGDRNFAVLIDDADIEKQLKRDGWNVKYLKPRDEDDIDQPYLQVTVGYKGRPPRIVMINSRGRVDLDEETVEMLDWMEFENVDLIINPYQWEVNGKSGVKAYLKTMFVTILEDDLERKYADIADADVNPTDMIED